MNKKMTALAVTGVLVAGLPTVASAAARPRLVKHTRVVTITYQNPCGITLFGPPVSGPTVVETDLCPVNGRISLTRDETFASVTVRDDSRQATVPVLMARAVPPGTAVGVQNTYICGSIKNLPVLPKRSYDLQPAAGTPTANCVGVATSGVITVTLTNYKR